MTDAFSVVAEMLSKYGGGFGQAKPLEISRTPDDKRILVHTRTGLPKEFFEDMQKRGFDFTNKVEMTASNKRNPKLFVPWIVFERKEEKKE